LVDRIARRDDSDAAAPRAALPALKTLGTDAGMTVEFVG
jgi:hypothetical protein